MDEQKTSTLLATERAMQPAVRLVTLACSAGVAALLGWSFAHLSAGAWLACALPALVLVASNLHYLRTHALTTVGMIPVALFSLLPALVSVLETGLLGTVGRLACTLAVAALGALALLFGWWALRLRRAYVAHPQLAPDAALIVLGGAIKRGRPCTTLALRLDVAARSWHESPTRLVVVTGGPTPSGATTEADEMARYLRAAGVDGQSILLERQARNTRENMTLSCKLLDARGFAGQRCVVSSDYHLWRALREARALGISLTPMAAPTPPASILQQWCREILTILSGR